MLAWIEPCPGEASGHGLLAKLHPNGLNKGLSRSQRISVSQVSVCAKADHLLFIDVYSLRLLTSRDLQRLVYPSLGSVPNTG